MPTVPPPLAPPDPRTLDRAADLLRVASRPVVIAGAQCQLPEDGAWLRALAEALPVPVLTAWRARGVLLEGHPLDLGLLTASPEDDGLLGLADLIVLCGLDEEELPVRRWPYSALVVCLSRTRHGEHPVAPLVEVVGDLALILAELAPRLTGRTQVDWDMFELDRLKKMRRSVRG